MGIWKGGEGATFGDDTSNVLGHGLTNIMTQI